MQGGCRCGKSRAPTEAVAAAAPTSPQQLSSPPPESDTSDLQSNISHAVDDDSIVTVIGYFDDEEIGDLLRQGARTISLLDTIEHTVPVLPGMKCSPDFVSQKYANGFVSTADVFNVVNPKYLDVYLKNHSSEINVGVAM